MGEYESKLRKRANKNNKGVYYGIIYLSFICLIFSLIAMAFGGFFEKKDFILISLVLLLFSEIFLLVSTFIDIYNSRSGLYLFLKNPSSLLLRNTDINGRSKIKFSKKLVKFELDDLELAKIEILYERVHFDKRTSIITGSIDKIGIFPTILATFILILTQLSNIHVQKFLKLNQNFQFYFYAIVILVSFFQLVSVFNNFVSLKLDNMVNTLEYTIKLKKGH